MLISSVSQGHQIIATLDPGDGLLVRPFWPVWLLARQQHLMVYALDQPPVSGYIMSAQQKQVRQGRAYIQEVLEKKRGMQARPHYVSQDRKQQPPPRIIMQIKISCLFCFCNSVSLLLNSPCRRLASNSQWSTCLLRARIKVMWYNTWQESLLPTVCMLSHVITKEPKD